MPSDRTSYESPFSYRYGSDEMRHLWSPGHRHRQWRLVWYAAAKALQSVGYSITDQQLQEMKDHLELTEESFARAAEYEKSLKHDVMAHLRAFGDECPLARPIIHLGMTSQDVVCNADVGIILDSFKCIKEKIDRVSISLANFADKWKSVPTLGFTHFQAAQPLTVGRRAAQWLHDLDLAMRSLNFQVGFVRYKGLRGATGTQSSFIQVLGSEAKACEADKIFSRHYMGRSPYELVSQTYPRIVDAFIMSGLAGVAAVLHKIAVDIRLLSHMDEIREGFGKDQVGSSAMPYKRNPMTCESICGICRFVMNLVGNAYETAATQWLERTLDDSSNRRLVLPDAFLGVDAALSSTLEVIGSLQVNEEAIAFRLEFHRYSLCSEALIAHAVSRGFDRNDAHEAIRVAWESGDAVGKILENPMFAGCRDILESPASAFTGRSEQQVIDFLGDRKA